MSIQKETTEGSSSVQYGVSNFEEMPLILDIAARNRSNYYFTSDMGVSLKAQAALEEEYGSPSRRRRLSYLRGYVSTSSKEEVDNAAISALPRGEGEMSVYEESKDTVGFRLGKWNPYESDLKMTAQSALDVIQSFSGFEDLTITQWVVRLSPLEELRRVYGLESDCVLYHGQQNVTPLGITTHSFNPKEVVEQSLEDAGVDVSINSSRLSSLLFTDYVLLDNGICHTHFAEDNLLESVAEGAAGERPWSLTTQIHSQPYGLATPVYEFADQPQQMVFRHNRE